MKYKIFMPDGNTNIIVASLDFVQVYCNKHGYTYEEIIEEPEEPTVNPEAPENSKTEELTVAEMAEAIMKGVNAI